MRESVKSMRLYFIVVGLLTVYNSIANITRPNLSIQVQALSAISIILGIAFFYAAITLKSAIENNKIGVIQGLICANFGWGVATTILGSETLNITRLVVITVVFFYLFYNLKQLTNTSET